MAEGTDGAWLAEGESEIRANEAYYLIQDVGIRHVQVHPACDEITLADGRLLTSWEGGYEHARRWTVKVPS